MRRILVWGAPGTGKSTLARAIGARLGLPVIHLDAEYWRPGWVAPAQEEWLAQVTALAARDAWVMDGNYSATWHLRLPLSAAGLARSSSSDSDSRLPGAWVPAESRLLASLASGAG
jgi:adenylate kinase family enzyme